MPASFGLSPSAQGQLRSGQVPHRRCGVSPGALVRLREARCGEGKVPAPGPRGGPAAPGSARRTPAQ
eukprot:64615-Alexandrium_andersonii.AAC.1